jgi:DNA-binding phage protein
MLTPTALTEVDRAKNYSKLTKTAMFDRETLQKSSLAGKKNNGEQLDPTKLQMIIGMLMIKLMFDIIIN